MASTDARYIPIKNQAYRLTFDAYKAVDSLGSLNTSGTGMDTELSKDAGTFADATNEATEIATSSGIYYIDLTAAEMNCDTLVVKCTFTNTSAMPSVFILYPQEAGDIQVNVTYWNGTAVATPDTAGYPKVTHKVGTGAGELDITNGSVLSNALFRGTASAGGTNTITLAGAVATDSYYKYALVRIISGTGAGQVRLIIDYVGSTTVATVGKPWTTTPDNTSVFSVLPNVEPSIATSGLAQSGAANTITLASNASATDSIHVGQVVVIVGGTGLNQSRIISGYVGATKVATVDQAWITNPDSTSVYEVMTLGRSWADVFEWNGAVVATPDTAGYPKTTVKVGTGAGEVDLTSGVIKANMVQILATAFTESGAGRLVAGIKKYFDVVTPASTMELVTAVTTVTNLTNAPANGDLTATMKASVTTAATASTPAAASVTGNVGGLSAQAKTDVQTAMTSQGYTSTRAGYLDTLNGLVAAIWASVTRTLSAGTNIVLAKGVGVTGFNDLSAAQVNTEADTALSDVGVTTTITGRIDAAISTRSTLTAAQVWAYVVEGSHTALGYMRIIKSILVGKVTGANTTNPKFYDDTGMVVRVNATTDGSGNRESITLDES